MVIEYAPVKDAALLEKLRLIRLGSNTFPKEIPIPINKVPAYSIHEYCPDRIKIPNAIIIRALKRVLSIPNLFAIDALIGEKTAKAISGNEVKKPIAVVLKLNSLLIHDKTGAIPVKGKRKFKAISNIPIQSSMA
jgi:hypothetical protein